MKTYNDDKTLKGSSVSYTDENGNEQQGWYENGHVYQDEALTTPIGVGSTFRDSSGRAWKMGQNGGQLISSPTQYDAQGQWIPQGNGWYQQMQAIWDKINNREPFDFQADKDGLMRQFRDIYTRNGQRAMEDTMGKAAGLTGGYGSSYAESVGQQQYNEYMQQLNDRALDIYDRQRSAYDQETQDLFDRYSIAMQQYGRDYDEGRDRLSDERYGDELDYQRQQDEYSKQQTAQADARDLALMMIQTGSVPDDEMLTAAGIDKAYAQQMASWYKAQSTVKSGGGYRYSKTDNDLDGDLDGDLDDQLGEDGEGAGVVYGAGINGNLFVGILQALDRYVKANNATEIDNLLSTYSGQMTEAQWNRVLEVINGGN